MNNDTWTHEEQEELKQGIRKIVEFIDKYPEAAPCSIDLAAPESKRDQEVEQGADWRYPGNCLSIPSYLRGGTAEIPILHNGF